MSWAAKEAELDRFYELIQKTILDYQSAVSGLVGDGRVGFVRDTVGIRIFPKGNFHFQNLSFVAQSHWSVFCAAAMWSLSLAYRLTDDDGGRRYELEQCCVKVRLILYKLYSAKFE